MRIWVTGAKGYVGRAFCRAARAQQHDVIALARVSSASDSVRLSAQGVAVPIALNLDSPVEVTELNKVSPPDVVLHLAWYADPKDYLVSPENVSSLRTTLAFARAVFDAGCPRFIGVGTCLEYADISRRRLEDDGTDPRSLYARSKHAAHIVLEELSRPGGGTFTWARLFHMHGRDEHPSRLIPTVVRALRRGERFGLSPGDQIRDHLDIRDVAGALLHLCQAEVSGTVNVCSGVPVTLRDLVTIVGSELGRAALLDFGARPYSSEEVMNLSGQPGRLAASGWSPVFSDLRDSLRQAIHYLSDTPGRQET